MLATVGITRWRHDPLFVVESRSIACAEVMFFAVCALTQKNRRTDITVPGNRAPGLPRAESRACCCVRHDELTDQVLSLIHI